MKQVLIACLIIFAFSLPLSAETDLEKAGFHSNIQSVHTFYYDYKEEDGEYLTNLLYSEKAEYNDNGFLVQIRNYNENRELTGWQSYKYNSNDQLTESSFHSADGSVQSSTVFIYNSKGQLLKESFLSGNGEQIRSTSFKYDNRGNTIEALTSEAAGNIKYKMSFTYQYDPAGRILEQRIYGDNNKLTAITRFTWDGKGRKLKEVTLYEGLAELNTVMEFDYNESGLRQIMKKADMASDIPVVDRTVYKRDAYSNPVEILTLSITDNEGELTETPISLTIHEVKIR